MELYMDFVNISLFVLAVSHTLGSLFSNVTLNRIEYTAKAILFFILLLPETLTMYGVV